MIQRTTRLKVADNSGAKVIMCIGIPHYSNRVVASLGDEVSCVVKSADAAGTVKDDEIVRLKARVYDILVQQENIRMTLQQMEQKKQEINEKIRGLMEKGNKKKGG